MVLEISVIEESQAPDVACSSLLDVTAIGSPASYDCLCKRHGKFCFSSLVIFLAQ
jgi:hypothetical protein